MKSNKQRMILIGALIIFTLTLFMNYRFAIVEKAINTTGLIVIEMVIILIGILCTITSIYICNKKEIKPEKAFLYIVPIFCIIFSVVVPVSRGHDEYMHWIKSYEVSEGKFFTNIYEGESLANIPKAALNIVVERTKGVFKYVDNLSLLNEKIDKNERTYSNNQNAATYCFIQYVPQAIGIACGRMITKVPLLLAYFGRTFNMITCIILMYFAIKNIPFGKNVLLVLSLIPITIEGFATMSADGITIALTCFFIAYTFKIIFDEKQECGVKQIIILTIAGAVLALCKFVYLPVVFLAVLIPQEKFKNRKHRMMVISLIIGVAIILNLAWLYFGSKALVATDGEGAMAKIIQIITNPLVYIEKVMYTITNNANDYFLSMFGGLLEWNEMVRIEVVPYIILGLIILATMNEPKLKYVFTKRQKIVILFIIISIIGLIFTSIFLQWTKSRVEINGVQGRYFIPILPLILFMLGKIKIKVSYESKNVTKMICITGYIVMLYTIISIMAIHI